MKEILLIEDNEDHAELIIRALTKGLKDLKIHRAELVKDASRLLKKRSFDLILSDYYLPDSKGESHIRALSKIAPDTPIIIITGQGDEKTAARSIKAGADDYIVKTREALQALPRIINRSFTKHRSRLEKEKRKIKKEIQTQKSALGNVFEEIEKMEEKIKGLKLFNFNQDSHFVVLDNMMEQVNGMKNFLKKIFLSGK